MLRLVLPKGSLEEQTFDLFRRAGLEVRAEHRGYSPTIADERIGLVKLLRPQEIPKYVEEGYFDLGITGKDWIVESGSDVAEVADLGYNKSGPGEVRLVLAVPKDSDVKSARDIKPGSRISTEYPNLTRRYFESLGIPVQIHFSYGATEGKIPDLADAIVDLTETGETLRKSGLKIVDVLLTSTARLIANRRSYVEKRKEIEEIKTLLVGAMEAREKVLLVMNVPEDKLRDVISILPAMKRPTVSKLYGINYCAVETVALKSELNVLIPKLKEKGAEDILEIPISKIVR